MITHVIFDVDGTLLDSMSIWDDIGARFLCSLGIRPPSDLYDALKNLSMQEAADYLITRFSLSMTGTELTARVNSLIQDDYACRVPLKNGVRQILDYFYHKRIPMYIATASNRKNIIHAFDRLNITHYFQQIYTCDELGFSKNTPEFFRTLLHQGQLQAEHVLVFEDVLHALISARAAGCQTAGVFEKRSTSDTPAIQEICDLYILDFISSIERIKELTERTDR